MDMIDTNVRVAAIRALVNRGEPLTGSAAEFLFKAYDEAMEANGILENICEHMASDHIVFGIVGSEEKVHPDWCVQCVLDKLRDAIAERTQWAHEHSHGDGEHGSIADWRECPMPTCFEARALVATKLPFSEET